MKPDLSAFFAVVMSVLNLAAIDTIVSIVAGLVAIIAGGWAIWDRWQKRRKAKHPGAT